MIQAVFLDAFGTLCEIREKRNPYKPILKAWPSGVANAHQALMTRDSSPADLAREAGCTSEAIQKMEEGIAAEVASMTLYPEVPALLESIKKRGLKWAIVSNLATPYAEPLLKLLPFAPDACAWSFAVGLSKAGRRHISPRLQGAGRRAVAVLMAGDSLENDYNIPKQLDMQARFLKRSGKDENTPEWVVNCLKSWREPSERNIFRMKMWSEATFSSSSILQRKSRIAI